MEKLLVVLLAVLFLSLLLPAGMASAETLVYLVNGTLVVKEKSVKTVKTVPGVPAGISAEIAHKLVKGELKEVTTKDKKGKKTHKFSYPLMRKTVFSDNIVAYDGAGWIQKPAVRTEEAPDWLLTIFWLWIPALGVLIISLVNTLSNIGQRKLFVFYISMFAGVLAGMLVGGFASGLAGVFASVFVGVFAGGFAGVFTGGFAGGLAGVFASVFTGGFAGGFAGMFAGGFANKGNYKILVYYFAFLLAMEIISFIVSQIAGVIKNHIPAIKRWVEAK